MGPRVDFVARRFREAPPDVRREAYAVPAAPKKQKNVTRDALEGKVGRIYMPRQQVDEVALFKPKGVRRERRQAARCAGKSPA